MKTRIITGVVAAALFIPFVIYGKLPFTLLVYVIAAVGIYEILRMKKIVIYSVPGILSLFATFVMLMPSEWEQQVLEWTTYSKLELLFITAILLLIYSVLVKNRFTFDDVAFVILSTLYVGVGFYYLIATRDAGLAYIIFALLVVWTTDSGAYFTGRTFREK